MPAKQEVSKIENIRHSLSHLLAAAVLKKFPDAKLGIGPVIENGFYYDFLLPSLPDGSQGHFAPDDLKELERTMRQLIAQNLPFSGEKLTPAAAKKLFKDQPFKLDLIKEFTKAKEPLSIYKTGDAFFDLCSGGHVDSTKEINPDAFKLDRLAGAYWRSDEKNPQLQRIYGLAFETKEELEKYLKLVEEAQKRDHRKLGKRLDLFTFSDMVGSGLPLWTPRGALVRGLLNEYVESLQAKAGYTQVWTPQIAKAELFKTSGHYDKYRESMFRVKSNYSDEESF